MRGEHERRILAPIPIVVNVNREGEATDKPPDDVPCGIKRWQSGVR